MPPAATLNRIVAQPGTVEKSLISSTLIMFGDAAVVVARKPTVLKEATMPKEMIVEKKCLAATVQRTATASARTMFGDAEPIYVVNSRFYNTHPVVEKSAILEALTASPDLPDSAKIISTHTSVLDTINSNAVELIRNAKKVVEKATIIPKPQTLMKARNFEEFLAQSSLKLSNTRKTRSVFDCGRIWKKNVAQKKVTNSVKEPRDGEAAAQLFAVNYLTLILRGVATVINVENAVQTPKSCLHPLFKITTKRPELFAVKQVSVVRNGLTAVVKKFGFLARNSGTPYASGSTVSLKDYITIHQDLSAIFDAPLSPLHNNLSDADQTSSAVQKSLIEYPSVLPNLTEIDSIAIASSSPNTVEEIEIKVEDVVITVVEEPKASLPLNATNFTQPLTVADTALTMDNSAKKIDKAAIGSEHPGDLLNETFAAHEIYGSTISDDYVLVYEDATTAAEKSTMSPETMEVHAASLPSLASSSTYTEDQPHSRNETTTVTNPSSVAEEKDQTPEPTPFVDQSFIIVEYPKAGSNVTAPAPHSTSLSQASIQNSSQSPVRISESSITEQTAAIIVSTLVDEKLEAAIDPDTSLKSSMSTITEKLPTVIENVHSEDSSIITSASPIVEGIVVPVTIEKDSVVMNKEKATERPQKLAGGSNWDSWFSQMSICQSKVSSISKVKQPRKQLSNVRNQSVEVKSLAKVAKSPDVSPDRTPSSLKVPITENKVLTTLPEQLNDSTESLEKDQEESTIISAMTHPKEDTIPAAEDFLSEENILEMQDMLRALKDISGMSPNDDLSNIDLVITDDRPPSPTEEPSKPSLTFENPDTCLPLLDDDSSMVVQDDTTTSIFDTYKSLYLGAPEDDPLFGFSTLPPYNLKYSWEPITEFTNRSTFPEPSTNHHYEVPQKLVVYESREACEQARRDIALSHEAEAETVEHSFSSLYQTPKTPELLPLSRTTRSIAASPTDSIDPPECTLELPLDKLQYQSFNTPKVATTTSCSIETKNSTETGNSPTNSSPASPIDPPELQPGTSSLTVPQDKFLRSTWPAMTAEFPTVINDSPSMSPTVPPINPPESTIRTQCLTIESVTPLDSLDNLNHNETAAHFDKISEAQISTNPTDPPECTLNAMYLKVYQEELFETFKSTNATDAPTKTNNLSIPSPNTSPIDPPVRSIIPASSQIYQHGLIETPKTLIAESQNSAEEITCPTVSVDAHVSEPASSMSTISFEEPANISETSEVSSQGSTKIISRRPLAAACDYASMFKAPVDTRPGVFLKTKDNLIRLPDKYLQCPHGTLAACRALSKKTGYVSR